MPKSPHFSPHAATLTDTLYSPLLARALASGRRVTRLHIGDTYREPPPHVRADALGSVDHPMMHAYPPVQGIESLRRAFSEHLEHLRGVRVPADAIQVTSGATSGVAAAVHTICDVEDEVLVPAPYWPLLRGVIVGRGAVPVEVPVFDRLHRADFDLERELATRITDRTVAVYLNSPNNPTGALLEEDHLRAVVALARRHDLFLLFDEAYEALTFAGAPPAAFAWEGARDRAIVFHTLSKSHAIAGSRIGFVHAPPPLVRALRGMHMHLAYAAPQPLQHAAVRSLEDTVFVDETRALYAAGARTTAATFGARTPAGGTFVFADVSKYLPSGAHDARAFLEAAADVGVLLTPGTVSGRDYATFVRVCFTSAPPDELADAMTRLAPLLETR